MTIRDVLQIGLQPAEIAEWVRIFLANVLQSKPSRSSFPEVGSKYTFW
jgi:hypothetical protein